MHGGTPCVRLLSKESPSLSGFLVFETCGTNVRLPATAQNSRDIFCLIDFNPSQFSESCFTLSIFVRRQRRWDVLGSRLRDSWNRC